MQSGMINKVAITKVAITKVAITKVAITKASVIDSKGMKHVIPNSGAVYADKGYCDKNGTVASQIIFYFICHFWYKFLLFLV
jgi:hypothetical protein